MKKSIKILRINEYELIGNRTHMCLFIASQQPLRTHKKKKKIKKRRYCRVFFFAYQHTSIKTLIIRKILDT